jgi:hypothetical protein
MSTKAKKTRPKAARPAAPKLGPRAVPDLPARPTPPPARELPPSRPKVNLVDLARQSMALRDQHVRRDGVGRPVAPPKVAVRYIVEFNDGSILLAEGEQADVTFRYIQECEHICATQGLAYYDGPGMKTVTRAQLLERLQGV